MTVTGLLVRMVNEETMSQERMQELMKMKHRVTGLLTEHQLCSSAQVTLLTLPTFTHLYNPRKIPMDPCCV